MKKIAVALLLLFSFSAHAQQIYPIIAVYGLGLGADFEVSEMPGLGATELNIQGAGGFTGYNYLYQADPTQRIETVDEDLNYGYLRVWGDFQGGLKQNLDILTDTNETFFYLMYRGELSNNSWETDSTYAAYDYYDKEFVYQNSIISGIKSMNVDKDAHGGRQGQNWEISFQQGIVDAYYSKLMATFSYFHTFFSVDGEHNIYTLYGGFRIKANYNLTNELPFLQAHKFAGLGQENGLGSAVRGLEGQRFAGKLMSTMNFDIRHNLGELEILGFTIYPGIINMVDLGFAYDPDKLYYGENTVFRATGGSGIYFDIKDIVELGVFSTYSFNDELIHGGYITPINILFGFHF